MIEWLLDIGCPQPAVGICKSEDWVNAADVTAVDVMPAERLA